MEHSSHKKALNSFRVPALPASAISNSTDHSNLSRQTSGGGAVSESEQSTTAQATMYRAFETTRQFLAWASSDEQSRQMSTMLTRNDVSTAAADDAATLRIAAWYHSECQSALWSCDMDVLAKTVKDMSLVLGLTKDRNGLSSLARFRAWKIEGAYKEANAKALTALRTKTGDFEEGVKLVKQISEDRQQTLAYAEELSRGDDNLSLCPPVVDAWVNDMRTGLSMAIEASKPFQVAETPAFDVVTKE